MTEILVAVQDRKVLILRLPISQGGIVELWPERALDLAEKLTAIATPLLKENPPENES